MPDPIYQSALVARPDAEFVAGELSLAVAGNQGRSLHARRPPLSLIAVYPELGEIECRFDAFEDGGPAGVFRAIGLPGVTAVRTERLQSRDSSARRSIALSPSEESPRDRLRLIQAPCRAIELASKPGLSAQDRRWPR